MESGQLRWWDGVNWTQQTTPSSPASDGSAPVTLAPVPTLAPEPVAEQPAAPTVSFDAPAQAAASVPTPPAPVDGPGVYIPPNSVFKMADSAEGGAYVPEWSGFSDISDEIALSGVPVQLALTSSPESGPPIPVSADAFPILGMTPEPETREPAAPAWQVESPLAKPIGELFPVAPAAAPAPVAPVVAAPVAVAPVAVAPVPVAPAPVAPAPAAVIAPVEPPIPTPGLGLSPDIFPSSAPAGAASVAPPPTGALFPGLVPAPAAEVPLVAFAEIPTAAAPAPVAPQPVAPQPVALQPVIAQPVVEAAPAPVAPAPVAPAPVAPVPVPVYAEPIFAEPEPPQPAAPQPVAPEPIAPAAEVAPAPVSVAAPTPVAVAEPVAPVPAPVPEATLYAGPGAAVPTAVSEPVAASEDFQPFARSTPGATYEPVQARAIPQPMALGAPTPTTADASTPTVQSAPTVDAPTSAAQPTVAYQPSPGAYVPFDPNAVSLQPVPVIPFSSRDPFNPASTARPALRSYGSAPVGPSGSTYTGGLWLIILAPLLSVGALFAAIQLSFHGYTSQVTLGLPIALAVIGLLSIAAAQFDRSALARRGYFDLASPFWILLLPPIVYLVVRATRLHSQGRGGSMGILLWLFGAIAAGIALVPVGLGYVSTVTPERVAAVQTQVAQNFSQSHNMVATVTCPSIPSLMVGTQFTCTAVTGAAATGTTTTVLLVSVTDWEGHLSIHNGVVTTAPAVPAATAP